MTELEDLDPYVDGLETRGGERSQDFTEGEICQNLCLAVCQVCSRPFMIERTPPDEGEADSFSARWFQSRGSGSLSLSFLSTLADQIFPEIADLRLRCDSLGVGFMFPLCQACYGAHQHEIQAAIQDYEEQARVAGEIADLPEVEVFGDEEPEPTADLPVERQRIRDLPDAVAFHEPTVADVKHGQMLELVMCSAFQITGQGHYGAINGCRIGFLKAEPNGNQECNAGLGFLAHLVSTLSGALRCSQRHRVDARGAVFEGSERVGELRVPPSGRRGVAALNKALTGLFATAGEIFRAPLVMEKCGIPPFVIDIGKNVIETVCFLWKVSDPAEWSMSMKFLLFNLKVVLTRFSATYLNRCKSMPWTDAFTRG